MAERRGSTAGLALTVVFGVAALGLFMWVMQLRSEVSNLSTAKPAATPGAAAPTPAAAAPTGAARRLDETQRQSMMGVLGSGESAAENQVWFATAGSPEAQAYQREFAKLFQDAGWVVKANAPIAFNIKAGIYLFIADEDEPPHVQTVLQALAAAGIEPVIGRGYREFYAEKKKENPSWNGFPLAADQSYVIVIGPKPAA